MENNYVINAKTGYRTVTIMDEDNDRVIGSFKFNPTDSNLMRRANEVNEYLRTLDVSGAGGADGESLQRVCDTIAEKVDYLLGCKTSTTVFSTLGPLSVMEDGELFFEFLLDRIGDLINEITEERIKKKMDRVAAATAEYTQPDATE